MKRIITGILFTLLLVGMFTIVVDIQRVKALMGGTIYIRADGTVDPSSAPIQRNGDLYTLTDNVTSVSSGHPRTHYGIIIERDNVTLNGAGYTVQAGGPYGHSGIISIGCNNLTLRDLRTLGFIWGIYLQQSNNSRILNNTITNPYSAGIEVHHYCYNTLVSGNTVTGQTGINVAYASGNSLINNNCTMGITLGASDSNIVSGDLGRGLTMYSCKHNLVTANSFLVGIWLHRSSNNTIFGNSLSYLYLRHSDRNLVIDNNVTDSCVRGIWLYENNTLNTISGNNISNNAGDGIRAVGPAPEHLGSGNNTIAGNYISNNLGNGIKMENASYNDIRDNFIVNNTAHGISIHRWVYRSSDYNSIVGNVIANNGYYGIDLIRSHNTAISNNIIRNNSRGIDLYGCNYTTIHNNVVANNSEYGIRIQKERHPPSYMGGAHNTLSANTISNNTCGVELFNNRYSTQSFNHFYHNNFINNTNQVRITYSTHNNWNSSYPSGGNFWSDYSDIDIHSGPYQNETGGDGIWDYPYLIDGNNQDNYPLVEPWTPGPAVEDTEAYIEYVNETIQDLPGEIFSKPGEDVPDLKNDISGLFYDALENIDEGNYEGAIEKLNMVKQKIYEEIAESAERQEIISRIDDLIEYLESLL